MNRRGLDLAGPLIPGLLVIALGVGLLAHLVVGNLGADARQTALALVGRDMLGFSEMLSDTPPEAREEQILVLAELRATRMRFQDDCAAPRPNRSLILAVTGDGRRAGTPGWTPPTAEGDSEVFEGVVPAQAACSDGSARAVGMVQSVGGGRLYAARVYQTDTSDRVLIYGIAVAVLASMAASLVMVHALAARSVRRDIERFAAHLEMAAENRFRTRIPSEGFAGAVALPVRYVNALLDRVQALLDELSNLQGYIAHDIGNPLLVARRIVEDESGALADPQRRQALLGQLELAERRRRGVLNIIGAQSAGDDAFKRVRPGDHLRRLIDDMFSYLADEKGLTFSIEADDSQITAPPEVLDRMLENVLLNAVEHAAPGSVIRALVMAKDDRCRLEITNVGPAPRGDDLRDLFEPGVRRGAVGGGHGLGLAFVRSAATRLSGRVEALATPDGFCIRFNLPLVTNPSGRME